MKAFNLSASLYELMEDEKLSVPAFAKEISCTPAAVRRWLNGIYDPDPLSLIKIAKRFGVSADYLFGLSDAKACKWRVAEDRFMDRYRSLKDAAGVTDYKICQKCGIKSGVVSKWKDIEGFPKTEHLLKLVSFFGCTLDYLLGIGR